MSSFEILSIVVSFLMIVISLIVLIVHFLLYIIKEGKQLMTSKILR